MISTFTRALSQVPKLQIQFPESRLKLRVTMTRQEKKKIADPKIVTDAVEVAEEAGLRYVSDDQPGYTRKAKGDDLEYFDAEGKPIRDEQRLLRIKRL